MPASRGRYDHGSEGPRSRAKRSPQTCRDRTTSTLILEMRGFGDEAADGVFPPVSSFAGSLAEDAAPARADDAALPLPDIGRLLPGILIFGSALAVRHLVLLP